MHVLLITDFPSVSLPRINLFRESFRLDSTDSSLDCSNFDQIEETTVSSLAESDKANHYYLCRAPQLAIPPVMQSTTTRITRKYQGKRCCDSCCV